MTKKQTVVFIGHNECFDVTAQRIEAVLEQLIQNGVYVFLNGGQGGFDRKCALCVQRLKEKYPHISNRLVIPYLSFSVFEPSVFDEILYPDGFERLHFKAAIPARNRYMVDNADIAVCYVTHTWGGAAKTFAYAKKQGLPFLNLGQAPLTERG